MSGVDATVAVAGAGPAGAAAARVLARAGIGVLLVSVGPRSAFQVGESLVPAGRAMLEELGVWRAFLADGHLPCYGNVSAWGGPELGETDFIRSPYGHGWRLDRARFDTLLCRMAAEGGATLWERARVRGLAREERGWRLTLQTPDGPRDISRAWLLDCTGRGRHVATSLGVARRYADRLVAFYARFRPDGRMPEDQDSRILVESTPRGWFHTAALPSRERIVTFFTDADLAWAREAKSAAGFLALTREAPRVAATLRAHGYAMAEGPRATDARSSRLDRFHGAGWMAAGDAATSFDPLSAQGILSALYSGLKAGQALADHLGGDHAALPRYDALIAEVYDRFLDNRLAYYGYEQRWPDSPFWTVRLR